MLFLPAVEEEVRGLVPARVALGRLDPDHLGAEVGEDHRGQRTREPLAEIEHSQTGARPRHVHSPVRSLARPT